MTWEELFFFLRGSINELFNNYGYIEDWSEAYGFHIIHRIPLNYDETPYYYAQQGERPAKQGAAMLAGSGILPK